MTTLQTAQTAEKPGLDRIADLTRLERDKARGRLLEEKLGAQAEEWDHEIEHLDARVDIILCQIEDRYYGLLRDLRARESAFRELLVSLHSANTSCGYQPLESDLTCAASALGKAINEAKHEIDGENSSIW